MSNAEFQRTLGRIEGKTEDIIKRLDAYEKRIQALEKAYWKWAGVSSAVMVVWTILAPKVLNAMGLG